MIFGITMGDSSGVGPEILLKAFRGRRTAPPGGRIRRPRVLEHCNARLGYRRAAAEGAAARRTARRASLNVVDLGLLRTRTICASAGISAASGAAAREYVVAATRAALHREIAAMVTLPMNKEATQLSDPGFTGHTELIASLCGVRGRDHHAGLRTV